MMMRTPPNNKKSQEEEAKTLLRRGANEDDEEDEEEQQLFLDEEDDYHLYSSPSSKRSFTTTSNNIQPPQLVGCRDLLGFVAFVVLLLVGLWNIQLTKSRTTTSDDVVVPSSSTSTSTVVHVGKEINTMNNDDLHHLHLISEFRQRLGDVSVDLMFERCHLAELEEEDPNSLTKITTINIDDFVDLVNDIIDVLGIQGLYDDIFNVYSFTVGFKDSLRNKGLSPNLMNVVMEEAHQGPETRIKGRPCPTKLNIAFWYKHWLGAVIADKLVREGSLKRSYYYDGDDGDDDDNENLITDAGEFFQEMYQLTSARDYPDLVPYHSVHGFWWQYVSMIRPNITEYPYDLFQDLCQPWLTVDAQDFNEHVNNNSMYRECRHGIGHAVFYAMHLRHNVSGKQFTIDVRNQYLEGTFALADKAICEGQKICQQAPRDDPDDLCYDECWNGGFHHSMKLFRPTKEDGEKFFRNNAKLCKA